jgi:hypothetical protein
VPKSPYYLFREFPKRRRARGDATVLCLGVPGVVEKGKKTENAKRQTKEESVKGRKSLKEHLCVNLSLCLHDSNLNRSKNL